MFLYPAIETKEGTARGKRGVFERTHTRHRSDRSYRTDTDQMRAAIRVGSTFWRFVLGPE